MKHLKKILEEDKKEFGWTENILILGDEDRRKNEALDHVAVAVEDNSEMTEEAPVDVEAERNINDLPKEILSTIFRYLDLASIKRVRLVSR